MNRPVWFLTGLGVVAGLLVACSTSGGGGGNGGGGNGGTISGPYNGLWSGNTTNTVCTDSGGFATAGYCSQLSGAAIPISLNIVEGPASATPCVDLANGPLLGNAQGGCATSTTPRIIATVGTAGDLQFTGVLSGTAGNPFDQLTVTVTSWDSSVSGTTMTGTWAATITSASVAGNASVQFALTNVTQISATAQSHINPVEP